MLSHTGASRVLFPNDDNTATSIVVDSTTNYSKLPDSSKDKSQSSLKVKQDVSTQTILSTYTSIRKSSSLLTKATSTLTSNSSSILQDSNMRAGRLGEISNSDANALENAFKRCSLRNKPSSSCTSYSVMVCKRRQQRQVFTTENLLPTCNKCRSEKEHGSDEIPLGSQTRSRRTQRRSWPIYSHSSSKKLSPPLSPLKRENQKLHKRSKSPASISKESPSKKKYSISRNSAARSFEQDSRLSKQKRNAYTQGNINDKSKATGDTISFNPFPPIPLTWRRPGRSMWDDSAAHLLDMTVTFLRKLPKVKFTYIHSLSYIKNNYFLYPEENHSFHANFCIL